MGISGLLPLVNKASRPCSLSEFSGSVAVVDTYCWLHKGAFSCADRLALGEPTDGYVVYVMKMVRLLLSYRIKPIMVFDGCNLPSKAGTEAKRREGRSKNRALAKELLREGRVREAKECFQRCVDVTSAMAKAVMDACRAIDVDVIVAPYEADAQLAYLAQNSFADLVITEDSDLIVFGCDKVLFKLDANGGGVLVERSKLHLALGVAESGFRFPVFRDTCILSGCDYLASLPGIGLGKACKFFALTVDTDTYNVLSKLPAYLKMPQLEVTLEYRDNFLRAVATFLHQLVYCPRERKLRPLTEYTDGSGPVDHPYAGAFVGHDRARQIALGNIDVQTQQAVANYDPDRGTHSSSSGATKATSIWHRGYDCTANTQRGTASTQQTLTAFARNDSRLVTGGKGHATETSVNNKAKQKQVDIMTLFTKRKREKDPEPEVDENLMNLVALYSMPSKSRKEESFVKQETKADTPQKVLQENPFSKFQYSPINPFATRTKSDTTDLNGGRRSVTSKPKVELMAQETVHGITSDCSPGADNSQQSQSESCSQLDSDTTAECATEVKQREQQDNIAAVVNHNVTESCASAKVSSTIRRRVIVQSRYFRPVPSTRPSASTSPKVEDTQNSNSGDQLSNSDTQFGSQDVSDTTVKMADSDFLITKHDVKYSSASSELHADQDGIPESIVKSSSPDRDDASILGSCCETKPRPISPTGAVLATPVRETGADLPTPVRETGADLSTPVRETGAVLATPVRETGAVLSTPVRETGAVLATPVRETGADLPTPVRETGADLSTPVRDTRRAAANAAGQERSSSPYFTKKPGACRRPGLTRPAARQLSIRDMFAAKR